MSKLEGLRFYKSKSELQTCRGLQVLRNRLDPLAYAVPDDQEKGAPFLKVASYIVDKRPFVEEGYADGPFRFPSDVALRRPLETVERRWQMASRPTLLETGSWQPLSRFSRDPTYQARSTLVEAGMSLMQNLKIRCFAILIAEVRNSCYAS
jgi:hypothetical protein